jgi:DNA-binding response OmpR family regulator
MKILLIEPDKLLAQTYAQALQHAGHKVNVAPTAQAAIFAADERRPDLVLLEVQLVSHSGIEFLYEFRSYPEWQDIPVVIVSHVPPGEFADSWELLKGELGVRAYRYKPRTSLKALLRLVNEFATVTVSVPDRS